MPKIDIQIWTSIGAAERTMIEQTIEVSQERLEEFLPASTPGQAQGWPHAGDVEEIIFGMVKEEYFPDEVTPVRSLTDLQRLGVTSLSYALENKEAGGMSSTPLYRNV